jgi:hypothetical protein
MFLFLGKTGLNRANNKTDSKIVSIDIEIFAKISYIKSQFVRL